MSDPAEVDVSPEEIAEALRCPGDYLENGVPYLDSDPLLFRTWSLGPRFMWFDGEAVHQVHEGADLVLFLREYEIFRDEWQGIRMERHGKWWDHVSYRVLEEDGTPSRIFRVIRAWYGSREGESGS